MSKETMAHHEERARQIASGLAGVIMAHATWLSEPSETAAALVAASAQIAGAYYAAEDMKPTDLFWAEKCFSENLKGAFLEQKNRRKEK